MQTLTRSICLTALALLHTDLPAQNLKVYILAGQSNMEGHAKVETFDYIGDDPSTAALLQEMRQPNGDPRVCEDLWISYLTGSRDNNGEGMGKLTAGYGSRRDPTRDGGKIGPEFTFGLRVGKASEGPVLIIKTAWGGKSLHTDFRPPSAGPYRFTKQQLENFARQEKDIEKAKADKAAATGRYYRFMIDHVKYVLGDIERVYPGYDGKGYELAGFAWFQGWNDMVDRGTYPDRDQPGGYDQYTDCLADFIRDVRRDLSAPDLPFVIGVMGVGGPIEGRENARDATVHANFRAAMAAPADLPEFRGNVVAVQTAGYWDMKLAAISKKRDQVRNMTRMLRTENKNHANRDGSMSPAEQRV
ncbi:MAG: sialate O-acetylesterase, partial [Planctomycetota bacterium]